jgi:pimeloyl-ACP methyl ester carboxylesterase
VLLAWGQRSWEGTDPVAAGVVDMFRDARAVRFEGGHWLHHDCFDAFIARTRQFLATGA